MADQYLVRKTLQPTGDNTQFLRCQTFWNDDELPEPPEGFEWVDGQPAEGASLIIS